MNQPDRPCCFCSSTQNLSSSDDGICNDCRTRGVSFRTIKQCVLSGVLDQLPRKQAFVNRQAHLIDLSVADEGHLNISFISDGEVIDHLSEPLNDPRLQFTTSDEQVVFYGLFPVDEDQAVGFIDGVFNVMDTKDSRSQRDLNNLTLSGLFTVNDQ